MGSLFIFLLRNSGSLDFIKYELQTFLFFSADSTVCEGQRSLGIKHQTEHHYTGLIRLIAKTQIASSASGSVAMTTNLVIATSRVTSGHIGDVPNARRRWLNTRRV
jgi:hypothetical protein